MKAWWQSLQGREQRILLCLGQLGAEPRDDLVPAGQDHAPGPDPMGRRAPCTSSIRTAGSGCRNPVIGGTAPLCSERSVTIASTAPEPATRWPVVPLTAVTGGPVPPNSASLPPSRDSVSWHASRAGGGSWADGG